MCEGYKIITFRKYNLQLPHYFSMEASLFTFCEILLKSKRVMDHHPYAHQQNSPSSISPAQVLQQTWRKLTLHATLKAAVAAAWGGNSITPLTPYSVTRLTRERPRRHQMLLTLHAMGVKTHEYINARMQRIVTFWPFSIEAFMQANQIDTLINGNTVIQ